MEILRTANQWAPYSSTVVHKQSIRSLYLSVIVSEVSDYLRQKGLINKHQHGFLSRRSTTTNLMETFNEWTLAINDKASIISAYIDYSKAFDVICHNKLLHKLAAYGVAGNLLSWIRNFLSGPIPGNTNWPVLLGHSIRV